MLSCFHLIPERNGQTDGQADRFAISISHVSILTCDKNDMHIQLSFSLFFYLLYVIVAARFLDTVGCTLIMFICFHSATRGIFTRCCLTQ